MTIRKAKFRCAITVLQVLTLGTIAGCSSGSKFTGTLCESCGNGPVPSSTAPIVISLNPSTIVAGSPAFILTVTGKNFAQGMTVGGIGTTSTTYVSPSEMQAQIPASAIATPSTVTVIAVTSPPSTLNFGASFTITVPPLSGNGSFTESVVPIQANDMVWDALSQKIYLSVSSTNGTSGNTITELDPLSGQFGITQKTGSEPDKLTISSDGSYLYAGIDGASSVQRFTLPTLATDISIPLGTYSAGNPYYALDVQASPVSPQTVAIIRGVAGLSPKEMGGISIYDNGIPRATSVPGAMNGVGPIDFIRWNPNGEFIYGIDTEDSGYYADFYVLSATSTGVQLAHDYQSVASATGNFGAGVHYDATTGYVYANVGQVLNPSTGAVLGSFPTGTVQGGFADTPVMIPDGKLNIAYFLGQTLEASNQQEYALEAFNLTNFKLLGSVPIPNVVGTPVKLIRWGTNGLAFLTGSGPGGPGQGDGVYLISGAFVTSPAAQNRVTRD